MRALTMLIPIAAIMFATGAYAAGDLSRADPKEIVIEMGTTEGRMFFKPNHLDLETGKAYKIVLRNLDDTKHEFAGHELIEKLFTRKVEIADAKGGLVAEIKGNVREIEVGPNREVEWFIVPIQTGENIEMVCEIEGHKEAGMFGTVTIK